MVEWFSGLGSGWQQNESMRHMEFNLAPLRRDCVCWMKPVRLLKDYLHDHFDFSVGFTNFSERHSNQNLGKQNAIVVGGGGGQRLP